MGLRCISDCLIVTGILVPAKFPHRDADGSFHVEVLIEGIGPESIQAVQSWIEDAWMPEHNAWKRVFRTGEGLKTVREEVWNYFDEFQTPPEVGISRDGLAIRFSGKPSAKWWRDWLVRFLGDFKQQFPSAEVAKIRDYE